MNEIPNCPECHCDYTYEDNLVFVCPECSHEWQISKTKVEPEIKQIKDSNGTPLQDGDSVTVIKDLKVKGASSSVKVGTKVKNIRLVEGDHDIDCKIPGFGSMKLKSQFVKKI